MDDIRQELIDYTMHLRKEGIEFPLARDVVYVDGYLDSKKQKPEPELVEPDIKNLIRFSKKEE